MAAPPVEDFPYTLGYVKELLRVDESVLLSYVQALGLNPRLDTITGQQIFTHRDVELLKKAIQLKDKGTPTPLDGLVPSDMPTDIQPPASMQAPAASRTITTPTGTSVVTNRENIAVIIEAVSQAKEGILKDLSRLLDDKLSGLDEVVVELIRAKSENDSLRQKLHAALADADALRDEVSRFKPVQFGFYRKV